MGPDCHVRWPAVFPVLLFANRPYGSVYVFDNMGHAEFNQLLDVDAQQEKKQAYKNPIFYESYMVVVFIGWTFGGDGLQMERGIYRDVGLGGFISGTYRTNYFGAQKSRRLVGVEFFQHWKHHLILGDCVVSFTFQKRDISSDIHWRVYKMAARDNKTQKNKNRK